MTETPVDELNFEQAMRELESVVDRLDKAEVGLADSIALYERGALLKKRCDKLLNEAYEKVALITRDDEGNATGTRPLEGL